MDNFKFNGVYNVKCFNKKGNLMWEDTACNRIPKVALDDILNILFHGASAHATLYIGLKNVGTVSENDTLASHPGWVENTNYAGDRKEFIEAESLNQAVTNIANKAVFVIDTNGQTIAGAMLASAASGNTGMLVSAANFVGGDKVADSGYTLEVEYIISAASV